MNVLLTIILLPAVAAIAAYFIRHDRLRRALWLLAAAAHFVLSVKVSFFGGNLALDCWIGMDPLSAIFLSLTSLLFLVVTIYGIGYVAREPVAPRPDFEDGRLFRNEPESVFTGSMLLFLATMSLAVLSRHFALQWVAIEATTLASLPLIYYHQNRRSLEAAWKYIILCSVGIALALLGVFFVSMALPQGQGDLTVNGILTRANHLDHKWLGIAFIFMLVGYGTKMGLAPLHSWLPDAHSEAPSPVSALLSGALLNCAFVGILRLYQVCCAADMTAFGGELLVIFGLLSLGWAGVFMLRQFDYKRMLAYSSVEHMGIAALGVGLGGVGFFGAFLHAVNHSLVKAMLFMLAGNILARFHTKSTSAVKGLCRALPFSGVLWVAGFLAITGSPPFGLFISEFTVLKAALGQGHWMTAALYMFFLLLVFVGMTGIVLRMSLGGHQASPVREPLAAVLPPTLFAALALLLGLYLPGPLLETLQKASLLFGGAGQ